MTENKNTSATITNNTINKNLTTMKNIATTPKEINIEAIIDKIKELDNPGKIILIGGIGIVVIGIGIVKVTEIAKEAMDRIGEVKS